MEATEKAPDRSQEARPLYCALCFFDLSGEDSEHLEACQQAGHRILPIRKDSIVAEWLCGCIVHEGGPCLQWARCQMHEHADALLRAARAVAFAAELSSPNGASGAAARLALDRLKAAVGRSDGNAD